MRIWFNHWFSTAYHLINMIKADTNNEFYIIGTSTNSSAIYKMTCDEWYSEEKDISASDYIDFCVEFCKEHNVEIFVPRRFLAEIIANKNRFDAIGVRLFANTNAELVQMLDDKQSTYAYFKSKLPEIVPETRVAHSLEEFCLHYDELNQIATRVCYKLYRRIYDAELRTRLADRYATVTKHDCDLTSEWWDKFNALTPEKLEKAKNIIALNKFKDGDYICEDKEINDVLAYYKITRDDTESN